MNEFNEIPDLTDPQLPRKIKRQIIKNANETLKRSESSITLPNTSSLDKNSKLKVISNIENKEELYYLNKQKLDSSSKPIIYRRLYPIICDERVLLTAYSSLRKNKGGTTPGFSSPELDGEASTVGTSRISLNKLQKLLVSQEYFPTPVRQIWIPKPRKKEKRPLGIPDFKDRIVGEAIRMVLNAIYEPEFKSLDCNYGFRPKLSCHDAIEKIQIKSANGKYIALEADIKGAYPSLDHNILITILKKTNKRSKIYQIDKKTPRWRNL